ncbi:two-component regulator propeller domain-containing protein [Siansivirga zeaxanthinifaciens]|uniref:histidine kinase n=1 Tax=Siansivirga zeaxanthinifaciens CC-SAMT-1 TaxID=1454006 RepID=A0A0C5WNQ4_9FLAO|nr:two-component regulator propeller domain-containing protein [Siansivirga zeaxanthinifaciens]AJR04545.1 histidine kinase [Siansivirga zeaxanthinifaciens CC-SAMT-1]
MHRLFVIFFFFSSVWVGFTQNEIYKFTHITTLDGLSQNSVINLHQDDLGQIWIATRDGLNKYDGTEFTVFRHQKDNPSSISNNDVTCIKQGSDGFIWVGTTKGLNRYNPKNNTFKTFYSNVYSLAHNTIWAITELSNKELWIGTPFGLSIYYKDTDSFKSGFLTNSVHTIFETTNGSVYIGTRDGLKQLVSKENNSYQFKTIKGTEGLFVQDIIESPNGSLLFGTKTKSVLEYNIKNETLVPYFTEATLKDKNRNVRQLLLDEKGKLWIGTYNGLQIADESKKLITLHHDINDSESISDNFIKTLLKDQKGSIWVGTYQDGINIWDESNINFINITQKPGNTGLNYKAVSSIVKHKKQLFFGTEGGGISIWNTNTKTFEHITKDNNPELKDDNIKNLCISNDDKLWIGTFEHGFSVYNLNSKSFENTEIPKDLLTLLDGVGVLIIKQYDNDTMLIGTMDKGLIKYDVKNKLFNVIDTSLSSGLSQNSIRAIKVDSNKNIWLSTNIGLNVIDAHGTIKSYFYDKESSTSFPMTTIFEDAKGTIWVGTDADGLFKLVNNNFVPVDLKLGNTSLLGVRDIVENNKGDFWISTSNQGIIHYNPANNKIIAHYTQKQGLANNQFNNNASLRVGDSKFFFGGPAGAIYFDANNFVKNNYSPQVILTDFKIKNKSISAIDKRKIISNTITYTKDVKLSHEQGNFNISFAIPNYVNSIANRYIYRLKGLEDEWIETAQNSVSYTIQNPGNYTFEVKGINNDGVSNKIPTTLNIKVSPAPWRTWWAFFIYGMIIFIILYYLLNILKSRTKLSQQLEFEQIQAEQAKEINKAKLEFFTNISHEFRTPLTLILGPLHQILENYRGSSIMYKKLKVIESNAKHLLQLINRLMDFRKLENNLIKLEAAEGNIVKFLKEIYLSFSEYANDGNYDFNFYTTSEEIFVYYDRYKLERVFYNLISNAFRFTPKNGKITIRITEEPGNIKIQVEDTGVGIAKEYRDKIFERFFELTANRKPDQNYNKSTGIGLSIVKNIVELHKGNINVFENENDKGSIFAVELPLGRDHLKDDEIIQDFKFSDDLSQYVYQKAEPPIILEEDILESIILEDKPTILLVEDNKPLRKFMRDLLKQNYNVLEAKNGQIGFNIALKEQVDIIVSDVIMPVMTGTELCSIIKNDLRTSHIPLILLTSRSSLIFKIEGLESGADDYISKPFDVNEFKLRIKNILNSISLLKQRMTTTDTKNTEDIVLSSLDEKLYVKALQIVEKNIGNEQFDIPSFCEELGVSRTVLFKKVKAWTNFTPNEFIQHIRLKKGAQLLEQGKINISQISYVVGFKNPKYFSKCFRKKYGKTPTEYAKTFLEY